MRRSFRCFFPLVVALALASAACEENVDSSALNPTPTPDPESVTETFSGPLNRNGAVTHTFTTSGAGTVVAALLTIAPDPSVAVSLGLGTWSGNACQIVLANDNAVQGVSITGSGSAAGAFCVRISDAGKLTDSITYEVRVTHP